MNQLYSERGSCAHPWWMVCNVSQLLKWLPE